LSFPLLAAAAGQSEIGFVLFAVIVLDYVADVNHAFIAGGTAVMLWVGFAP
jgi:hypothetical protein